MGGLKSLGYMIVETIGSWIGLLAFTAIVFVLFGFSGALSTVIADIFMVGDIVAMVLTFLIASCILAVCYIFYIKNLSRYIKQGKSESLEKSYKTNSKRSRQ
ncbi:MAG: hypothetical protein HON65_16135 [Rhodospirillales bacterium]|jgi:hypothetical protein|nr:hypothetical protein [Rhodospirillales bacterium]